MYINKTAVTVVIVVVVALAGIGLADIIYGFCLWLATGTI